jgi:hypothetical protein
MVDWYMIKTNDTTRRVAQQTKLYMRGMNMFKSPMFCCQKQMVGQTRCRRHME